LSIFLADLLVVDVVFDIWPLRCAGSILTVPRRIVTVQQVENSIDLAAAFIIDALHIGSGGPLKTTGASEPSGPTMVPALRRHHR
jgi:hypothetical protein